MRGISEDVKTATFAFFIFTTCLLAYLSNRDVLVGGDAVSNVHLAVRFARTGELTLTPLKEPFLFSWRWTIPRTGNPYIRLKSEDEFGTRVRYVLLDAQHSEVAGVPYYLIATKQAAEYGSTFGPGSALAAAPFFAIAHLFMNDLEGRPAWLWYGAKVIASLFVAASAVFVFLSCLNFFSKGQSALVGLAYGLGTSVWSVSSQILWQQTPSLFFLSLGMYLLSALNPSGLRLALGGMAFGSAFAVRPLDGLFGAVFFMFCLITRRRRAWFYVLGSLVPILYLLFYNFRSFGQIFSFGQLEIGKAVALGKTGSSDVWQTPLWEGLSGLLFSPGRGLFLFTPTACFGFWGLWRSLRVQSNSFFKASSVGVVLMLILAAKWFDWWGGWTYSYRPILAGMPFLAVLAGSTLSALNSKFLLRMLGVLFFTWSIYTQILGAFAYNLSDWNAKNGQDIDNPLYRGRLWSLMDSPILFYTKNFTHSRESKKQEIQNWLNN
ncbi:MAG: hypothetical protein KA436_02035 [Oligoflexales bacterium]|nr:hypothetical protein [Oligoflexales bacterium]